MNAGGCSSVMGVQKIKIKKKEGKRRAWAGGLCVWAGLKRGTGRVGLEPNRFE